jgi:serine protease inhibitor
VYINILDNILPYRDGMSNRAVRVSNPVIRQPNPNPVTAFGCTLVKELFSDGVHNVAVSPYSIWTALAMTECATEKLKEASQQMGALLRYDCVAAVDTPERNQKLCEWYEDYRKKIDVKDKNCEMLAVNAIFTKEKLDHGFQQTCEERFKADTMLLSVNAKEIINNFVKRYTNGMIKEILDNDPAGDTMLVNAIYFKGTWIKSFDIDMTREGLFQPFGVDPVTCRMMTMKNTEIQMRRTSSYQIVKLDYGSAADDVKNQFSAFIASPVKHQQKGEEPLNDEARLNKVVHELFGTDTSWAAARSQLHTETVDCLCIPKFTAQGGVKDLMKYMRAHGVSRVFENGGLHNLTDTHMDYISQIAHKSQIQINETGTTAAASTVVATTRSLIQPHKLKKEVIFDHPFIFAVVHNTTDTLIFAARVNTVETCPMS